MALAVAGCGSSAERPVLAPPAEPRTIELGWVERGAAPALVYRVERLTIRRDGWSADISVQNSGVDDVQIRRPHRAGKSLFGLVLLETSSRKELNDLTAGLRKEPPFLEAERIEPRLPISLGAGTTWRGRLSGSTVLRRGTVVRLIFGRFTSDRPTRNATWVTDHSVRL